VCVALHSQVLCSNDRIPSVLYDTCSVLLSRSGFRIDYVPDSPVLVNRFRVYTCETDDDPSYDEELVSPSRANFALLEPVSSSRDLRTWTGRFFWSLGRPCRQKNAPRRTRSVTRYAAWSKVWHRLRQNNSSHTTL